MLLRTWLRGGAGGGARQGRADGRRCRPALESLEERLVLNDPPLTITALTPPAGAVVAVSFTTTVATFTDADPAGKATDFTALIDWGDGTSSVASAASSTLTQNPNGSFAVKGTHTYNHASPGLPFRVTVNDSGGASVSLPAAVVVTNPRADTIGAFDRSTGNWYLRNANTAGAPDAGQFAYGGRGWLPVLGNWNGANVPTVGAVDVTGASSANATWYLRNENSAGAPDAGVFQYGSATWLPVSGDWGNFGHSGIGMFDPASATWYLRNSVDAGIPDAGQFRFGVSGIPVVGDWRGTGRTGIGVFDPATATWFLRNTADPGAPDAGVFRFGAPGWIPVVGDWGAQGFTGIGVFDPATATFYLRNSADQGAPDVGVFRFGGSGWIPVAGDYDFPGLPLHDTGGLSAGSAAPLTDAQLQAGVAGALGRLAAAGVAPAVLNQLASARFEVGTLPAGTLGLADVAANQVLISSDAGGFGWFVDDTPLADEEFTPGGPGSPLVALPGSPAAGKVDLLSTVLHEMGHLAGRPDQDGAVTGSPMDGVLAAGTRHVAALDQVFAGG